MPIKSSRELLGQAEDLDERHSSEEDLLFDSDMDKDGQSDEGRSRKSKSSEEERDTVDINPQGMSTFIPTKEQKDMWHYHLKRGEEHGPLEWTK